MSCIRARAGHGRTARQCVWVAPAKKERHSKTNPRFFASGFTRALCRPGGAAPWHATGLSLMFTAYRPSPPERRPCPARASTARKRVDCVSSKHTETRDATRPRLGAVTAYAVPQPQHRRQLAVRDAWEAAVGSNVARVTLASSTQGATRGSDKGCLGLPKPQPSAQYRPLSGGPSCAARRHASSTLQTAWCARPGRRRPPPKFAPQPFGRQTRICRAPPAPRLAPRPRDTPTAAPLAASAATASG